MYISPVNCDIVDILLSRDGGINCPFVLAASVPIDGSQDIAVP
jgi:hypothetical protein